MKVKIILIVALCCAQQGFAQPKEYINYNLDNYTIHSVFEDTADFYSRGIYSVYKYSWVQEKEKIQSDKLINGKPFVLKSYTEYLRDGRKRYSESPYDNGKRVEKYYYHNRFEDLALVERREEVSETTTTYYNWLFYDEEDILKEEFAYRVFKGTPFDFQKLLRYEKNKEQENIVITAKEIGYDTMPDKDNIYRFQFPRLIKSTPQYQSKEQQFIWLNGRFLPTEIKNYVVDGRDVQFKYDAAGRIVSEVWHNKKGLENKTEYYYSADNRERVQQGYHMLGKEKSNATVRRYNEYNDIVFEQTTEYTGIPYGITVYEYVYDAKGNWLDKKKYYIPVEKGITGKKQLQEWFIREIKYYEPGDTPRFIALPLLPNELIAERIKIPQRAAQKLLEKEEFDEAVQTGNFDDRIKTRSAGSIEAFTPKFWKLVDTAYGDLDGIEGDEAVAVFQTPIEIDMGFAHCLAIFKKKNNAWQLWHQTTSPVLSTGEGGMMGNPFDGISIERRCIVLDHWGGSRDKWSYTHRYRYQNGDWFLIGATSGGGAPCDFFYKFDYNLITGDAVASYMTEACEEVEEKQPHIDRKEKQKLKMSLPKMDDFVPGNNLYPKKIAGRDFYY